MDEKDFSDYLAAFRRYRSVFTGIFLGLLLLSLVVALLWPAVYRSSATILIEEQEIPPELVRSTITSFAAQRLQTINQRVMTRSNLLSIIDRHDLYASKRKRETTDEILERMRDDISFQTISADVIDPRSGHPTTATIAFSLSFDGEKPELAQKVTNEITNLYLEENLRNRTQKTAEAADFLRNEMEQVAVNAAELEKKLSAFKASHIDELPEEKPIITQALERTESELRDVDIMLRTVHERNYLIDSQLALVPPESPTFSSGEKVTTASDRLKSLRTAYISLVAKYSERHPDVIKVQQEIAALELETGDVDDSSELSKQLQELRAGRAELSLRYAEGHPDVSALDRRIAVLERELKKDRPRKHRSTERLSESQADNPAYLNLLAQKEANAVEIEGLNRRRAELRNKLLDYERRLQHTPEVERQYYALAHEWENAAVRHKELKAKYMEAEIGEQLERKSKGERFAIVEPPQLPEKPIKPNRPLLATLGSVFALAAAFAYVMLREALDHSIRKPRQIMALVGEPPLALIPDFRHSTTQSRSLTQWLLIFGMIFAITLLLLMLIHWFLIPLDVLWFRGVRKLDNILG